MENIDIQSDAKTLYSVNTLNIRSQTMYEQQTCLLLNSTCRYVVGTLVKNWYTDTDRIRIKPLSDTVPAQLCRAANQMNVKLR